MRNISDLAAVFAVAEADDGGLLVHGKQYCPAEQYRRRVADNLPYDVFRESVRLMVTDGNAIDQDRIIGRWGAVGFLTRLQEHGLPVTQFGQGFASMSAPCKEIERVILGRQLKTGA